MRRTLKSPKDDELLEKLKIKNFALKALPILKGNIKFLRGAEGAQFVDFDPKKIEQSLGAAYEGIYKGMRLAPRRKSGSERFDALADWQNPLRTDRERSLSEMLIEVLLDKYQLPYKYETAFVAGSTTYYPDFAILSRRSGEIVYWEHFGMMDNQDYVNRTAYKLASYANNGLCLGINLIASFGSKDKKITQEEIESIIKYFLLPQDI